MNENVEDLTVQYEENGLVVVKEVDKVILSRGAWATIIFRFQEWRQEHPPLSQGERRIPLPVEVQYFQR